jgi:hypothetical protein
MTGSFFPEEDTPKDAQIHQRMHQRYSKGCTKDTPKIQQRIHQTMLKFNKGCTKDTAKNAQMMLESCFMK